MIQRKPSLGRGLDALIGPAVGRTVSPRGEARAEGAELAMLPLEHLQRGRYQPRVDMRPDSLQELAESIKAQGIVQPIVVRPVPGSPGGGPRYEIIAGERRWRAAQMAGLEEIPALIRDIPDESAVAVALIENIQRENLNALEEARALERLIGEFHMTHQQAADAVGRSRAAVSNLLRLLELAPQIHELVERRELEMGHARALLGLAEPRRQAEVGAFVARKRLSVRETEALVRRMLEPGGTGERGSAAADSDPDVRRLEQQLAEKLGAKVAIHHASSGRGRLVIEYNSLEELDGILEHIR